MVDLLAPVERLHDVLEELETVPQSGLDAFGACTIREVSLREQADDAAVIDLRSDVTTFVDTGEGILGVDGLKLVATLLACSGDGRADFAVWFLGFCERSDVRAAGMDFK